MAKPSNLQDVLDEKERKKQQAAYDAEDSTPESPRYAYTASPGKTADDNFDVKAMTSGKAEMRESTKPDQKAMRYMPPSNDSLSDFLSPKAGAGRGSVNPKKGKGYAKGGSASSRADGIAQRGKTRGMIC
jgi:hypothetical protein